MTAEDPAATAATSGGHSAGITEPDGGTAAWLCQKAADDPQLTARAARYLAGEGASNDACLTARRYLEHYWQADPACLPSAAEYRRAAGQLEAAGQPGLAELFGHLAGTGAELAAAAHAWGTRYAASTGSAAEALLARQLCDGLIRPAADPCPGTDGAWYQLSEFTADPAQPGQPAVLVTAMTTRQLVAGFAGEPAAAAWLRDRSRTGEPRPLADPAVADLPRLTLEEHVLAWLLRHPGWLPDISPDLRARMWTADSRHEIDAALRTATGHDQRAGYQDIGRELHRRMLRAPGWAAHQVGWPFGHWAQGYLRRLASTTVTEDTARRAFQALTLDPAHQPQPVTGTSVSRASQPQLPAPVRQEPPVPQEQWLEQMRQQAAFLGQLGPGLARPGSLGSRMRIQPPQL